jgi:hypothetical protein
VAAALRARHAAYTVNRLTDPGAPDTAQVKALPTDIMRRIPVDPAAYQRWLRVWDDLREESADLAEVAKRHGFSRRQIQFVRRAGQGGLLNSPTPPAVRLADLATTTNHRQPGHGHLETVTDQ